MPIEFWQMYYLVMKDSIKDLLVKFKDIKSKNLQPHEQKHVYRSLLKLPYKKHTKSYKTTLNNYNVKSLEVENRKQKRTLNGDSRGINKQRRKMKGNYSRKCFKLQLNYLDKKRSIAFDLHPMVEEFMKRTMDKLLINQRKGKHNTKKTNKSSLLKELSEEDEEDEAREKLKGTQLVKGVIKEEAELPKQSEGKGEFKKSSHSVNPAKKTSIIQELEESLPLTEPAVPSKYPNLLAPAKVSAPMQQEPLLENVCLVNESAETAEYETDVLKRELSVLDMNPLASITKKPTSMDSLEKVQKPKKNTNSFLGETGDAGAEIQKLTQTDEIKMRLDKSTSSSNLMRQDASTTTESNIPSSRSKFDENKNVKRLAKKVFFYPMYTIDWGTLEKNQARQKIIISPSENQYKQRNKFTNNKLVEIADLEQIIKQTELQFSRYKLANKNSFNLNCKVPTFKIQFDDFAQQNNLIGSKKRLICSKSVGNAVYEYKLKRKNLLVENSFCSKNNISRKHSNICTHDRLKTKRKLSATYACPLIQPISRSLYQNKDNKLHFNKNIFWNNKNTKKVDKTQCMNRINNKNEIAYCLKRINSLTDTSVNMENFLRFNSKDKVKDEIRNSRIEIPQSYDTTTENNSQINRKDSKTISNISQHAITPIYINTDHSEPNDSIGNDYSETNSVFSTNFQKPSMKISENKRIFSENFRKSNSKESKELVNNEGKVQLHHGLSRSDCSDDKNSEQVENVNPVNSTNFSSPSEKTYDSNIFIRNENIVPTINNYIVQKQTNEEIIKIVNISGNNALTETKYFLNNENGKIKKQSDIKLNVECQNFKTFQFDSFLRRYNSKKSVLTNSFNNLIEEQTQYNTVRSEIDVDNEIIMKQSNRNNSAIQTLTCSAGSETEGEMILQSLTPKEKQSYESIFTVHQRQPRENFKISGTSNNQSSTSAIGSEQQPFFGYTPIECSDKLDSTF
uniref:Uncharacterized protein n=1 Tax=Rhodnius prolixus TaxID=13249 RepID=T1HSG4_RHOPR